MLYLPQAVLSPMMNGRTSSGDDPFSDLSAASPDTQPRQPQLKQKYFLHR
jgi:hypothetical protein